MESIFKGVKKAIAIEAIIIIADKRSLFDWVSMK